METSIFKSNFYALNLIFSYFWKEKYFNFAAYFESKHILTFPLVARCGNIFEENKLGIVNIETNFSF